MTRQNKRGSNAKKMPKKSGNTPGGSAGASEEKYTTSSGVTTPLTSDLSDSAFEYDVERNWSVIFSDDNFSTDHDIRSNYSSSSENIAEWTNGAHGSVISENEGDTTASETVSPPSAKRRDTAATLKVVQEEVDNSVTTLKGSSNVSTDGSFKFPDPVKLSKENEEKLKTLEIPSKTETSKKTSSIFNHQSIKKFPFFNIDLVSLAKVGCFLVLVLSVELYTRGQSDGSLLQTLLKPKSVQTIDEKFNALTIIRYATRIETRVSPRETVFIEYSIPDDEAVLLINDEYPIDENRHDYGDLLKNLFANFKEDTNAFAQSFKEKASQMITKASIHAFKIAKETKELNYHSWYDGLISSLDNAKTSVRSYWNEVYVDKTSTKLSNDLSNVFDSLKMNFHKASDKVYFYNYKEKYDFSKDKLKDLLDLQKDQFSKIHSKLESEGYLDLMKQDKRSEVYNSIASTLKLTGDLIGDKASDSFEFIKEKFEEFSAPNGARQKVEGSFKENAHFLYQLYKRSSKNAYECFVEGKKSLLKNKTLEHIKLEGANLWKKVLPYHQSAAEKVTEKVKDITKGGNFHMWVETGSFKKHYRTEWLSSYKPAKGEHSWWKMGKH